MVFQRLTFIVILYTLVQKEVADGQVENYIDIVKLSREGMEDTLNITIKYLKPNNLGGEI